MPDGYSPAQETGLYYLQSRYYNPTWGRFLNADTYVSTGQGLLGNNMFAYCLNNPVRYADFSGAAAKDCFDNTPLSEEDILKTGEGGGITLYRAVSPAEGHSATQTQSFSAGNNSYADAKFFATSPHDAQTWGNAMYRNGDFEIIAGTFHPGVISAAGTIYYPGLDGIGAAYLIPISALNDAVIAIFYV